MTRSKTKGPFVDEVLMNYLSSTKGAKHKKRRLFVYRMSKFQTRSSVILPSSLGRNLKIHNGKEFLRVTVSKLMIGHKFGEFSHTRQRHEFKVKKKKKTKK